MKVKAREAIAMAIQAASSNVATCVPGLGATDIFCDYCEMQSTSPIFSLHEEVAYTLAHGAALAGVRAFTCMKAHGFLKAANSVSDSLYSGTVAGFVSIVVDDRNGIQSDSILETSEVMDGLGIPHRTADVKKVFDDIIDGFAISERLQLPFALIIDASELDQPSIIPYARHIDPPPVNRYRDITQHVLCPPFCGYQRDVLRCKLSGGQWESIVKPTIRPLSVALPERWKPVAAEYANVFRVMRSIKGEIVAGDTGLSTLFALPPYDCIDVTTYMGGSVPLAIGAYMAGIRPSWAVSGDFSFIAAGHLSLLEAVQRQIPVKILLLYNGKAETTGGQPIPVGLLERVLSGYEEHLYFIHDPTDYGEVESVLKQATLSPELSIVVADFRESREGTLCGPINVD